MKNIKRFVAVGAVVLTVGAGSLMAYADSPIISPENRRPNFTIEEREEWRQERHSMRKDELKKAVANGEITEAEAKEWEDHFDYMEEFHKKNRDSNFMGRGHGMGRGRGMGMMRGNGCRNY